MIITVFGNLLLKNDSTPLKALPVLQKRFPEITFEIKDPTEECMPSENPWWIIDTVKGIKEVTLFKSLKDFEAKLKAVSRVSLHDFDLGFHLLLLKKISPDLEVRIIGVPPEDNGRVVEEIAAMLHPT
ncbi:hypothetical protein A3I42_00070 [Candidatus Uhrbacteria bacterium RIFCSPLOWO2_02_FULL_49_11]|uniref:Uncharacterized protein n=1 Tax=Candidatus Uhrbacteria bacterium RIFCSPLOWO2_02_FULL_49_11 TaxID=1802409 RepID=A0A1F7VEI3_9BACT|nr:MAG: hypothetical protein A3I42_00070 [Candidatus Uhrbacteria bacterium RIFCSPLOWO2_02_FULL_49_11]